MRQPVPDALQQARLLVPLSRGREALKAAREACDRAQALLMALSGALDEAECRVAELEGVVRPEQGAG